MTPDASLALLGLPSAVTDGWHAALAEPHRHYHGVAHITALLAALPDQDASREIVAAIWLHDVVYDARAGDNEERSADQARDDLTGSDVDVERVVALILSTKRHDGITPEQRLMGDLDLGILGSDPAGYADYAAAIRREYAHVPDPAYRAGRAGVLRRFLMRPAIYHGADMVGCEVRARANLAAEIAALEAAG